MLVYPCTVAVHVNRGPAIAENITWCLPPLLQYMYSRVQPLLTTYYDVWPPWCCCSTCVQVCSIYWHHTLMLSTPVTTTVHMYRSKAFTDNIPWWLPPLALLQFLYTGVQPLLTSYYDASDPWHCCSTCIQVCILYWQVNMMLATQDTSAVHMGQKDEDGYYAE